MNEFNGKRMNDSIRKNKNKGKTSCTIVVPLGKDPDTGRYLQKWITVKGGVTEAKLKKAEIIHQMKTGTYIEPGKTTLKEYLEDWLKNHAKPNLAPRTYEGYESIVRVHLAPALGRIILSQLKPEHIQKYYSDKLKSKCLNKKNLISPRTVRRHSMCLHCALETAVKMGLLYRNPADAVDPPPDTQTEMHTMDEDDIRVFLDAAKRTAYYPLFYTALYTGMRRSELLALRWSDIDLLRCQLSVSRSLHQLRDRSFIFRQPKTVKGRRLIALTPSNALVLKEHKENQIAQRIVLGTTLKEDDLVFSQFSYPRNEQKRIEELEAARIKYNQGLPNSFIDLVNKYITVSPTAAQYANKLTETGTHKIEAVVLFAPLLPDSMSNAWSKLAKRNGLKDCHLHIARHSMASGMLKMGIHPAVVQQRLGHASIQITIDTYSHILPGLQEAAALRLDDWMTPKQPAKAVVLRK